MRNTLAAGDTGMKSRYKREAWYLDEDILLHGYVDKRGFHPEKGLPCGFGTQRVTRKQKGRTWFCSLSEAKTVLGTVRTAGGSVVCSLDIGYVKTRVVGKFGISDTTSDLVKMFELDSFDLDIVEHMNVSDDEIARIVALSIRKAGYEETSYMRVRVGVTTPSQTGTSNSLYETTVNYEGNQYHMCLSILRMSAAKTLKFTATYDM